MPFTLTMPKLSPTMTEGTIAKWHKKEGDFVEAGDLLVEVSTDKATIEYNALDAGFLRKILVPEGGEGIVNGAIAVFSEKKDEDISGYKPEGEVQKAAAPAPTVVVAAPAAATAAAAAAPAAASGPGMVQAVFTPEPPLEGYVFTLPGAETPQQRLKASPLARKLAHDKGLDLSTVKGTGPGGRVVSRDLEGAQPTGVMAFGRREIPHIAPGTYEEKKMSPMRKVIGQRLQETKTFIPHFYVSIEVDAEPMHVIREQLKTQEIKITFNDFVVRGCALALRKHPVVNSSYNTLTGAIAEYKTIDISVAVSVEGGLITPIVRHADYKNLGQLSLEVKGLAKRARDGKLEMQEYKGGSFTISNLGMYGVTDFHAILNPPQGALLAVAAIRDVPVVKNGAVVPGKRLNLTLSVDHRVIDGAAAAEFLKTLKDLLENPALLLL